MVFMQTALIASGAIGAAYSVYRYYRRPSISLISSVMTVSLLAMMAGEALPFVWLAFSGTTGAGIIVGMDCQPGEKHHIRYRLVADGSALEDVGPDGYGNPGCGVLKIGDVGTVTYLEGAPQIHVWGRADAYVAERAAAGALVLILAPIFSYFGVRKRMQDIGIS